MNISRRQLGVLAAGPLLMAACDKRSAHGAGEMARDQLVFGAWQPEPLVALLVLQRQRAAPGEPVTLEAKAFIAARGELKLLFFERVSLSEWPLDLPAAVAAWQRSGKPSTARPKLSAHDNQLDLSVQLPSGGLRLHSEILQEAGTVIDPHGVALLRAGWATLTVNGKDWHGQLVAERLQPGARAWLHYRRFEMWVMLRSSGALTLARVQHGGPNRAALLVQAGQASQVQLPVAITAEQLDFSTQLKQAQAWQVGDAATQMTRTAGTTTRGRSPSGGPALYNLSVAQGDGALALVSGLSD